MYNNITSQSHRPCAHADKSKEIIIQTGRGGGDKEATCTDITRAHPQFICMCASSIVRCTLHDRESCIQRKTELFTHHQLSSDKLLGVSRADVPETDEAIVNCLQAESTTNVLTETAKHVSNDVIRIPA